MKIRNIKTDDPGYMQRQSVMVEKRYQIQAEIRAGVTLPESQEYTVRVSIGETFWETDKPKQGVN
jgi:hypothetical protein